MSPQRSPVSEFLHRIHRSGAEQNEDLEATRSSFPRRRQISFVGSALIRSSEIARKIGSTSAPTSPTIDPSNSPRQIWPGGMERSVSMPYSLHINTDKSLPDLPAYLAEAYNAANRNGSGSIGVLEKSLNRIGENAETRGGYQDALTTALTSGSSSDQFTAAADAIEAGVNTFLDGMPALMKVLDEVAKIHPFISVVVLAFKAVYTLEAKRRGNDQKIIALYAEMREMVSVLLHLKDIKDVNQMTPDGRTIKGRLEQLSLTTAEDIKSCANTCDAYSKKKLLVKILSGPMWESKLLVYVGLFTQRKQEFMLALSVHTAVGVNDANLKLDSVEAITQAIQQKMEVMMQMFHKFVTPEQQQMGTFIQSKGGPPCLENENAMKELIDYEAQITAARGPEYSRYIQSSKQASDLTELKRELGEKPDEAIERNSELFGRKFDIQQRQAKEEMARTVRRESDRIMSAITGGPHERLLDEDVYAIWKNMGWRGSVKAKHFVPAFRDYYHDRAASHKVPVSDQWTLQHITFNKAQAIVEAVDDDASGLITILQVNNFTGLRHSNWSLPHWIAYWAVGWQITISDYCRKIDRVISTMFHLRGQVKPANRAAVDQYLLTIWESVITFTHSFQKHGGSDSLRAKFKPYVAAEEDRLRRNMEEIRYIIDDQDTVALITGPGRIEMFIFPLLYLTLKRHLAIIDLGRTRVLGKEELSVASNTWLYIAQVAHTRVSHLQETFKHRNLNPKTQFKSFAHGLFSHLHDFGFVFNGDRLRTLPDPVAPDKSLLTEKLDHRIILNYPVHMEDRFDYSAYDLIPTDLALEQRTGQDAILGTWYYFLYIGSHAFFPMMSITLNRSDTDECGFQASGKQTIGGHTDRYTLEGRTGQETDRIVHVDFEIKYADDETPIIIHGELDLGGRSVHGTWKFVDEALGGTFLLKRSLEHLLFRPSPSVISQAPARSRWKFALDAVHHRVKRDLWSYSFFLGRFQDRKRYIELTKDRSYHDKAVDSADYEELTELHQRLSAADVRFYASLTSNKTDEAPIPVHSNVTCDNCDHTLGDARIICMDCAGRKTMDLCEDPRCFDATIESDKRDDLPKPHLPTHDIFKRRAVLHGWHHGMVERRAKAVLTDARKMFEDLECGSLGDQKPPCASCEKRVSQPCWVCVDCKEQVFICCPCESTAVEFSGDHTRTHTIVRCQPPVPEITTEQRLKAMEERLSAMEERLMNMGDGSNRMEEKLESLATQQELQVSRGNKSHPFKVLTSLLLRM